MWLKRLEPKYYSSLAPLREPKILRTWWPVVWGGCSGLSVGICFVCKFSEISAVCYCTVFSLLLWMWQSVWSSYCRQLNAVSFNTGTSCCTVQINIESADLVLFRYTAGNFIVLLWIWQSVCSSYCRQLNAVSFNKGTSCCTVQINIESADLVLLGTLQGILVCYCECGIPSIPVTALSLMLSVATKALHASLYRSI